jgi:hypothetical protein
MPLWLAPVAERGLSAVWEKIPGDYGPETRKGLLRTVASRLFEGYGVLDIDADPSGQGLQVEFVPQIEGRRMRARIVPPALSEPLDRWFSEDTEGLDTEISRLVAHVPLEALGWGGEALRTAIVNLFSERLPGWDPSIVVRNGEVQPVIEIRVAPGEPFVLAVEPHLDSSSLPVTLIRADIQEDIFALIRKVAGIPVPWLNRHREDFQAWVAEGLSDRRLVERLNGKVRVEVAPARITRARINLESRRYAIQGWIAAYAGTEDRYPELGLHLGRRVQPWSGWEAELYGEGVLTLDDFSLESRWGLRWALAENLWIGAERVFPEDKWWGRVAFDAGPRNTYAWWRYSEDDDNHFGIGYRLNEYISLELHYDDRDDDAWSIRALGNL